MEKKSDLLYSLDDDQTLKMIISSHKKINSISKEIKGLVSGDTKNVKIFKSANENSIMDITASLNYHKLNNKSEEVYKGKIILSITDRKKNNYIKFFLDKAKAKVLMKSIMDHTFNKIIFAGGFSDYGGTNNTDLNKITARRFRVSLTERNQFKFAIYEGKGKIDNEKGSFYMLGEPFKTVERYVPYEEALEMAHEVHDYIRDQELKALINGKPLYTLTNYNESSKTDYTTRNMQNFNLMSEEYTIQVEPWRGTLINKLSNQELRYIIKKTSGLIDEMAVELYEQTILEVRRRMSNIGEN